MTYFKDEKWDFYWFAEKLVLINMIVVCTIATCWALGLSIWYLCQLLGVK